MGNRESVKQRKRAGSSPMPISRRLMSTNFALLLLFWPACVGFPSYALFRPDYKAPGGRRWTTLPLSLDQGKAYVTANVQQLGAAPGTAPLPLRLVLDTGAGHALSLETTADPRLRLPAARLRTDLGRGLTGIVSGSLGRVAGVACRHSPRAERRHGAGAARL